jgi:hypothetical protein
MASLAQHLSKQLLDTRIVCHSLDNKSERLISVKELHVCGQLDRAFELAMSSLVADRETRIELLGHFKSFKLALDRLIGLEEKGINSPVCFFKGSLAVDQILRALVTQSITQTAEHDVSLGGSKHDGAKTDLIASQLLKEICLVIKASLHEINRANGPNVWYQN